MKGFPSLIGGRYHWAYRVKTASRIWVPIMNSSTTLKWHSLNLPNEANLTHGKDENSNENNTPRLRSLTIRRRHERAMRRFARSTHIRSTCPNEEPAWSHGVSMDSMNEKARDAKCLQHGYSCAHEPLRNVKFSSKEIRFSMAGLFYAHNRNRSWDSDKKP